MATTIVTNHQPRYIKYGYELAPKWRKHFDWIKSDKDYDLSQFVEYRGWVYALDEFMRCEHELKLLGFDGYHGDTYFSGILIRFVEDEKVVMAHYYS